MTQATNHSFTMQLRVHDPETLHAAASSCPDANGETLRNEDGTVNVDKCLVILLDPSVLAGCAIESSEATTH